MKLPCTLLAAALLAGCSDAPDPHEARIRELEADIARLQDAVEQIGELLVRNGEQLVTANSNYVVAVERTINSLREDAALNHDTMWRAIEALEQRTNYVVLNTVRPAPAPAPTRAVRGSTPPRTTTDSNLRQGIPEAVYNAIAADAARDWPGDFTMQRYQVNNQIADWKKLNPGR